MRKIISALLVLTIIMSLSSAVFAADEIPIYYYMLKSVLEKSNDQNISSDIIYNNIDKTIEIYIGTTDEMTDLFCESLIKSDEEVTELWQQVKDTYLNNNSLFYESRQQFNFNGDIITCFVKKLNKDHSYKDENIMLKIVNDKIVYDFLEQ